MACELCSSVRGASAAAEESSDCVVRGERIETAGGLALEGGGMLGVRGMSAELMSEPSLRV